MHANRQSENFAVLFIITILWRSHRVGPQFLVAPSDVTRVQKIRWTSENRRHSKAARSHYRR